MKRLYSLDSLRGLAALAIVVWHWQHFFAVRGVYPDRWSRSAQPCYAALRPLYEGGWMAVDLFFALSGFIFFWLYASEIRERAMGARKFVWLRFSRLYPLNAAALAIVALLQIAFHRASGHYFIFAANSGARFVSGLALAQQWLPPNIEQTFNGPAWSVSVEVLLYALFFAACRSGFAGLRQSLIIAVASVPLLWWNSFIARGVMGFFLGGATFLITAAILGRADARRFARIAVVAALLLWGLVAVEAYLGPLHAALDWLARSLPVSAQGWFKANSENLFLLAFIFTVSPISIAALALQEQALGGNWRRAAFLGDISYATYMLHFPLQLALALAALKLGLGSGVFMQGWVMAAFYALLIGLGWTCYRHFERPVQAALRKFPAPKIAGALP
jgi:peptidoglycan/LPS O-acetylase OafA/YrhL